MNTSILEKKQPAGAHLVRRALQAMSHAALRAWPVTIALLGACAAAPDDAEVSGPNGAAPMSPAELNSESEVGFISPPNCRQLARRCVSQCAQGPDDQYDQCRANCQAAWELCVEGH